MLASYATAESFADRAQALALELHALLRSIDPGAWREEAARNAGARLTAIQAHFEQVCSCAPAPELSPLAARVHDAYEVVTRRAPSSAEGARAAWEGFRRELLPVYDALAQALRAAARPVPTLRPTNLLRSGVHALSGLFSLAVIQFVPEESLALVAAAVAVAAWSLELSRRHVPAVNAMCLAVLGRISHLHEVHRVNSSTWFCTGLLVLALAGSARDASVGVMVLGFADPAAALIGRRFGRHRLASGRSWEGAGAFFVVGSVVAAFTLVAFGGGLLPGTVLLGALAAGLCGAAAELFSGRLDDNFTVPVASGLIVAALLGG